MSILEKPNKIENHKYDGNYESDYSYKGHFIHAGIGIHEYIIKYISSHYKKDISILVLGSGTGSFDCRLYDNGYENITSLDLNQVNYSYQNETIMRITYDLNEWFHNAVPCKYDLIVAIEVIEHLFSTRNFLVNCEKILSDKGVLLITTPNPRSWFSRWKFFLTGVHNSFGGIPQLYEHINPIHTGIFRHHCYFTGLAVDTVTSFNYELERSFVNKTAILLSCYFLKVLDIILRNNLGDEAKSILFIAVKKN